MMATERRPAQAPKSPPTNGGERALTVPEQRVVTLRSVLERSEKELAKAAGKALDPRRQVRLAMTMIQGNQYLGECSPFSVAGAVMQATQLGLELDGILGHAYLVPRRIRGIWTAQCQVGVRGYVALMHRSGRVQGVHADVVCENDRFKYQKGTGHFLHHMPALSNRGEMGAAYAVVHYRGGGFDFVVLGREEIERDHRAKSDAWRYAEESGKKDSPWHLHEDEMWRKTAIRKLAATVPLSPTAQRAALVEDYADAGISVDIENLTETPVATASAERQRELAERYKPDTQGGEPPAPGAAATQAEPEREPGGEG
jgi:recombination protein RecT